LRIKKGLSVHELYCGEKRERFLNLLEDWSNRGLGSIEEERFALNAKGWIIQDSLMDEHFKKGL
jgi:coproporphyrinogen III oxidase-like Fe-S oxidoreductase